MNKKLSKILTTVFEGNGTEISASQSVKIDNDFMDHSAMIDSGISLRLFSKGDDYVIDLEASRSVVDIEGQSDSEVIHRQVLIDKELVDSTVGFAVSLIKLINSGKRIRVIDLDKVDDPNNE